MCRAFPMTPWKTLKKTVRTIMEIDLDRNAKTKTIPLSYVIVRGASGNSLQADPTKSPQLIY